MLRACALFGLLVTGCSSSLRGLTDAGASSCTVCLTSSSCAENESCVQLENNDFCLTPCLFSDDCGSGFTCQLLTTFNGNSITACAATTGQCSMLPPGSGPVPDAGSMTGPSQNGYCGALAGPNVSGTGCRCSSGQSCSANNCYGGWYCDTSTDKCVSPPTTCGSTTTDAGMQIVPDAGPRVDGGPSSITASGGGTASNLYFVAVGDTRPANDNDTADYPTSIIDGIYKDIAALNPAPQFVLATGDYQFADPGSGQNETQIGYYMSARSQWPGILWPAMGNHECTGATASNCDNMATSNFQAFQSAMLSPIGETLPYYSRTVTATDGSWSAHFIFAASNYWDSTQSSWYQSQLSQSATYTFIIDHEYEGSGSPGDEDIFSMAENSPHTLHIVGHTHTWEQKTDALIVGNGGAPITGGAPYGYTTFERRASDGAIVITGYDYTTGQPASGEQFCISATGASVSACP